MGTKVGAGNAGKEDEFVDGGFFEWMEGRVRNSVDAFDDVAQSGT
ncbi:MAG TPA: hypothetical protein VD996_00860 [Chitinophagaceae bacterium]|nr:hypothetical protein [Chitinophagaceae bacterium]